MSLRLTLLTAMIAVTALMAPARVQDAGAQRGRCGMRSTPPCMAPDVSFVTVSAGQSHSCGIAQDGGAYCWGDGRHGALGDGGRRIQRWPQRVTGELRLVEIGAGGDFSCARSADGAIHCWGRSQAVPGWPEPQLAPVRVPFEGSAKSLTVGRRHACLIDADDRASCWGWNVDGETGTGTSGIEASMVARPTPVATDHRFALLSAGMGFTCGVTTDGAVLCWGSNIDGILGPDAPDRCGDVGPIPCATRPVPIALPGGVTQVSSGTGHACAITGMGAAYCWGANRAGQAGAYQPGAPMVWPPQVVMRSSADPLTSVSAGGIHSCAMARSGRLSCWGGDQLNYGRGLEPADVAPREAAAGFRFRAISAGTVHTCGVDTRHRLLCWGDSIRGALGVR